MEFKNQNLEKFVIKDLVGNFSKYETFIKSILDSNALKELHISKIFIGAQGIQYLSEKLKNDSNLTSLELNG